MIQSLYSLQAENKGQHTEIKWQKPMTYTPYDITIQEFLKGEIRHAISLLADARKPTITLSLYFGKVIIHRVCVCMWSDLSDHEIFSFHL